MDQVKLPVLPYAARKAKLLEWPDESDDLRRRSLHLIRVIVEADLQATKLGSMIYELSGMLSKEPQIQRAIELTFAKKLCLRGPWRSGSSSSTLLNVTISLAWQ